jgi:putative methyltransferase (TIGR04325 family)
MGPAGILEGPAGALLRWVPGLEQAYNERALARQRGSHRLCGAFVSRKQALRSVPLGREIGWDNEAAAALWLEDIAPVRPSSYPVFFWLSRLFKPDQSLLDLGGSIGLTYYGYRKFATLPPGAAWVVVEVPRIAARGRELALRESADSLRFTSDLGGPEACDLLLASGSLQYMERSVPGFLEHRMTLPRVILLNKVPFAAGDPLWSLDNFGPAVCPYRVFEEVSFLDYFAQRDYRVQDRWAVPEIRSPIAFHPEVRITYHGFCLELRA